MGDQRYVRNPDVIQKFMIRFQTETTGGEEVNCAVILLMLKIV